LIEASVWIAPSIWNRERVLLAERAADRSHRLADDEVVVVAELQRVQVEAVWLHLEQGDIGKGVEADDLGRDHVAVRELDVDRLGLLALATGGIGDDMGVGDDFTVVVEDEPGALGGATVEDRADRDHARRRPAIDLSGVEAIGRRLDDHPGGPLRGGRGRGRRGTVVGGRSAAGEERQRAEGEEERYAAAHARALAAISPAGSSTGFSAGGRSRVKAVNRLLEEIAILPSIRCASSLAIERPSPEPPAESAV
jgi:hypothetical protein